MRYREKWTREHERQRHEILDILAAARAGVPVKLVREVRALGEEESKRTARLTRFCRAFWSWAQENAAPLDLPKIEWAIRGFVDDVVMERKKTGVMAAVFGNAAAAREAKTRPNGCAADRKDEAE